MLAALAAAQGADAPTGIAAAHPGDRDISNHPAVVLSDDFEYEDVAELRKKWEEVKSLEGSILSLAEDSPRGAGRRCLQVTARPGRDTGGHLYQSLPQGHETLHLRFYVKFPQPPHYIHHFVHLGGYNPRTSWPQGGAGERPRGDERITVGIEPHGDNGRFPAPGAWTFYTYWHEMKVSTGGKYWGNGIRPQHDPPRVPAGRWQCVEVMVKLNGFSPTGEPLADGELALWLDGRQILHVKEGTPRAHWSGMGFLTLPEGEGEPFEGFRWRTSPDLKLNFVWLLHYVTDGIAARNNAPQPEENTVWFDNIVAATDYIGPIAPAR